MTQRSVGFEATCLITLASGFVRRLVVRSYRYLVRVSGSRFLPSALRGKRDGGRKLEDELH